MLNVLDFGILIAYVVLVLSVGCGAAWMQKRKAAKLGLERDDGAYFLAARTLKWPIIGLSLFSTNISTVHIVALCEEGYRSGLAYANFELAAVFTLVILAVFFVPFYLRAHVTTLPDFLEKRFNRNCRDFLAFLSIISAVFIHIGVSLYAGAVVINAMLGFGTEVAQLMPTMIMIAVATGLYVVVGGLLAVTLTDAIQTTTLLIGSAIVTTFAFMKLGGWGVLEDTVGPNMISVLRPSGDFSHMPWHAVVIGYPVIGIWYWCTDQTIVQRVLGAKDENHGKAGAMFAGMLKLLPMFLFVLPGLLCLALINKGLLPELADSKEAFAHMVMNLLPSGFRGLIVAALLAALMGTIAGALNSIATLFAFDLYKRFKPETSDKKLVHIGRIATVCGVILAIIWSPIIGKFDSIYGAIASMICYISPPITAVFMVGIFWKRATAKAGAITLWAGFAMGLIVFALDLLKEHTGWSMLFMHAAGLLCLICIIIMVVVSLLGEDTNTEENLKLVWDSPMTPLRIKGARGLMNYKFQSVAVMTIACIIYFIFRAPSAEKINAWKTANPEAAAKIEAHCNPTLEVE
ncbi:sodium:solute symporter family transporter [Pontiella sulfatireligans]|uniref:Sodium/glucose cotransporter n=1 Tax=Pontiella sulfatireligans TaxID=2750658 RepID=A0A6C2UFA2_9BACT|nr:sodium/solute symporter [Pontiella sulfatireligans]VGO18207.1 Sodium/glucose cotransporter [Pontiella sulfatireligans]